MLENGFLKKDLLQSRAEYNASSCDAFVADLTDSRTEEWPVKPGTVDFIIMLFTLSAIRPEM
jgi:hypothetical protein